MNDILLIPKRINHIETNQSCCNIEVRRTDKNKLTIKTFILILWIQRKRKMSHFQEKWCEKYYFLSNWYTLYVDHACVREHFTCWYRLTRLFIVILYMCVYAFGKNAYILSHGCLTNNKTFRQPLISHTHSQLETNAKQVLNGCFKVAIGLMDSLYSTRWVNQWYT